jgi:hypothetical protein
VELESKKRGRKTLLGDELDSKVKLCIQTLRSKGGVVDTAICRAVDHGIVTDNDKQLLSEFGGPITLTKSWAASLLNRMNFVKRRGSCTAKIHISDEKFDELKSDFLNKIDKALSEFDIPPELMYYWATLVLMMCLCQTGQWRSKDQRRCRLLD